MLNPFPILLDYQFYGPTLLRLVVGIYTVWLGSSKLPKAAPELSAFFDTLGFRPAQYYIGAIAIGEIAAGLLLILGFLTQIGAAILATISLVSLVVSIKHRDISLRAPSEYLFVLAISLALLLLGAGNLAFDWPL